MLPTAPNPAYDRGSVLFHLKRYEAALREFHEALRADPTNARAAAMIALCESNLLRPQRARDAAEHAIRINPSYPAGHHALAWTLFADIHFRCRRKGDIPATKFIDNTLRYRLTLADRAISEALRLNPRSVHFLVTKAHIALADLRPRDALTALETGLAIDPRSSECLRLRSHIQRQFGNIPDAKAASDEALASSPEDAANHELAGHTALAVGDFAGARAHFAEALRLDPLRKVSRRGLVTALRANLFFYRPLAWLYCVGGAQSRRWTNRPIRITLLLLALFLTINCDRLPKSLAPVENTVLITGGVILFIVAALHLLANHALEFDASTHDLMRESRFITCLLSTALLCFVSFSVYIFLVPSANENPSALISLLLVGSSVLIVLFIQLLATRISRRRLATLSPSDEML